MIVLGAQLKSWRLKPGSFGRKPSTSILTANGLFVVFGELAIRSSRCRHGTVNGDSERAHGMYKHNKTSGCSHPVMSLTKNELNPVKIVFPSCTSVEISEKMEISVLKRA